MEAMMKRITVLCSVLFFLSSSSTASADFANLRAVLNLIGIDPRSNFTNTSGNYGTALLKVNFTSAFSAQVSFGLNFTSISNVSSVGIYEASVYVSGNVLPAVNLSSRFSSLSALSRSKSADLGFTVNGDELIAFDEIYARPTNFYLMIDDYNGDDIRGQIEDGTPNFFPDGRLDVPPEDILNAILKIQNPSLDQQGSNDLEGTVEMEFDELEDGSYNVEFFISTPADKIMVVEVYSIKSNQTFFDFKPHVRLPSLNKNAYYRGRVSSMPNSTARALLSSPTSYGFRIVTDDVMLSGNLNSVAAQTPPPSSPAPSPPPPVSVDPGAEVGIPGVSSAPNLHLTFRKFLVFTLALLTFLALA